jgi:flagellar biosynthesis protein FlhF
MKIRKYQGKTETETMVQVKEELGMDALIVSVKQIKPRGLMKLFKKPYIEITAAIDDRNMVNEKPLPQINLRADDVIRNNFKVNESGPVQSGKGTNSELDEFKQFIERFSTKQKERQSSQSQTVERIKESMIDAHNQESNERYTKLAIDNSVQQNDNKLINKNLHIFEETIEDTPILKLIYEQLIDNEVDEPYANELMHGLAEYVIESNPELDDVVSVVYRRIIKQLDDAQIIPKTGERKTVFFIGPTGVGKTTTIAKIASLHTLNYNRQVALITSDTYRIAAVEQLRTYANILSIPIKVVYTKDELLEAVEAFGDKDLILVDTAGRSHQNEEHQMELCELLGSIQEKDVYLTISVATKYKDLQKIVKVYQDICDVKIIFTKLDETQCLGNILNIKMGTRSTLSYVTFGQNVPDDISEINPHEIAKNILGGDEDGSSK